MSPPIPNLKSVFGKAVELPPADRAAYLDEACADHPSVKAEVQELLDALGRAGSFMAAPAAPAPHTAPFESPIAEGEGTVIGPYTLREQIGEGGFGLVFVAEQSQPVRRKVALKVIKPGMDTKQVVARFEAERQALALMDHPHIAKVLDVGTTANGLPYFVMELVKGVSITEYCDANNLIPKDRLELFVQVCQAVQHAHQKGVIHRDLKPSNILVAPHDGVPVVKVIDFGVAKALGQQLTEKTIYTRFAQMIGTPLYMSPEQAEVNQLDVDTRSDVYSLGVLLYELLTGTTPFDGDRFRKAAFDEIRRIIKEEEPPRPSTRLTSLGATLTSVSAKRGTDPGRLSTLVRGDLDWIVMKCLEKDRGRRYDGATALAKDVQRCLAGDAVEACPPTLGYRLKKAYRKNVVAIWVVGLFGFFVSCSAAMSLGLAWIARQAERAAVEARNEALSAQEEANDQRERGERERRRAEEEKRAAEAVRTFLQDDLLRQADIFEQANSMPMAGGEFEIKPNPTIRELLDRAAAQLAPERIEAKFPAMPFVQAEVLHAVASAYGGVNEAERSRPLIDRAVVLYRATRGDDDPVTLKARKTQLQLSSALPQDRFDALMNSFLQDATRVYGPRDRMVLEARLTQASGPLLRNRAAEAIPALKALRAELTESLGPTDALTLMCGANLARAYLTNKESALAVREMENLRDTGKGMAVRFDHPMLQQGYVILADTYRAAGNVKKAIEVYEEILDGWKQRGQPYHANTWQPRHLLAWVYARNGNLAKGAELFEANVAAAPASFHAYLSLNALCEAEAKLGRDDKALVERARQGLAAAIGNRSATYKSWVTGHARIRLGQHLLRMKEYAEAEAMLTAGLREMLAEYPHVRDYSLNAIPEGHQSLQYLYQVTNRPDKEKNWLGDTCETVERIVKTNLASGVLRSNVVTFVEILVMDHIATGRHDEALALYRELDTKYKPANKSAADAWMRLSATSFHGYEAKLQFDRMKPWAELRIPTLERDLDALRRTKPTEVALLRATNSLAFSYLHAGRKAEVVKLAEEVIVRQKANGWRTDADAVASYGSTAKAVALADRPELAVEMSLAVLAEVTKANPTPAVLASATFNLGFAKSYAGDHADAEKHFRDAGRLLPEAGGKTWTAAKYKAWLGFALHDQKKYADAEPMLKEVYAECIERLASAPAWEKQYPLLVAQRLKTLCEATKKPDEAAKWKARSETK